jgi:uncharacterized membrane protein
MPDEMHPDLVALLMRLVAIEERQNRLEAKLEDAKKEKPESRPPSPAHAPPPLPTFLRAQVKVESPEGIPTVLPIEKAATPLGGLTPAIVPPQHQEDEQKSVPARAPHSLEQAIGLKWAGWIGAIVLAIGAGLGIKFAYEQGWLGHLPVEVRLFLMSLVGFALLAAGEVVYRRINVISAAAVFGAGVTVLFLISYAGNTYYGAYSYQTAFIYALLTTLIGSGVAIRGRLVSIAVLSQLGGQFGPIILSTGQPPGIPLLGYVLMLQLVALILALWGSSPKWWILRAVSLAGTSWWVLVSLLEGHWSKGLGNEVLWFAVVFSAVYQGELLRSGLVADSGQRSSILAHGLGTLFSLLVTAGLTAIALHVFYDYNSAALRGGSTLLLAASCLAGGFFWQRRDNGLVNALAIGYLIQGMALLLLFAPVTFTSVWVSLAWAVLSLAFASIGARFDRDLARGAAICGLAFAVGRLFIDATQAGPGNLAGETWIILTGHSIHAYTVIAWLVSLVGLAVSWLLQTDLFRVNHARDLAPIWQPWALGTSIAASVVWGVASLDGLPHIGATLALVLYAWMLFGLDFVPQKLFLAPHAVVLVLFAAMKWAWVDGLTDRLAETWSAQQYIPLLNPFMGMGILLAGTLAIMCRLKQAEFESLHAKYLEQGLSSEAFLYVLAILVLVILTIGLSFEADRLVERAGADRQLVWSVVHLKLFSLTILWEIAALVLALVGHRSMDRPGRPVGAETLLPWILFLFVAGKFVFVDMLLMRFVATQGPSPVTIIFNFQVLTAVLLLAGFFCLCYLSPLPLSTTSQAPLQSREDVPANPIQSRLFDAETGKEFWPLQGGVDEAVQILRILANSVPLLILLLAGTLEIDRAFSSSLASWFSDPHLADEVAISIFWSVFAISTVLTGFYFLSAWLRLFGLSLFGITVVKVLLIDLTEVRFGYRILSLLGLGLLLLATSVAYGKVGGKRLQEPN